MGKGRASEGALFYLLLRAQVVGVATLLVAVDSTGIGEHNPGSRSFCHSCVLG